MLRPLKTEDAPGFIASCTAVVLVICLWGVLVGLHPLVILGSCAAGVVTAAGIIHALGGGIQ